MEIQVVFSIQTDEQAAVSSFVYVTSGSALGQSL